MWGWFNCWTSMYTWFTEQQKLFCFVYCKEEIEVVWSTFLLLNYIPIHFKANKTVYGGFLWGGGRGLFFWSPTVRRLSVCPSLNFSSFRRFLQNHSGPISAKLYTKHPWFKGIQNCSNEGSLFFPRRDNYEIEKIHWWNVKMLTLKSSTPETLD